MDLSIENLTKSKAFTSKPVPKEIVWEHDGVKHKFKTYIRPLGYHTAVGDISSVRNDNFLAARIASSICDGDGKPVFAVADLIGENDPERGPIADSLTHALLIAIGEVQNLGKTPTSKK